MQIFTVTNTQTSAQTQYTSEAITMKKARFDNQRSSSALNEPTGVSSFVTGKLIKPSTTVKPLNVQSVSVVITCTLDIFIIIRQTFEQAIFARICRPIGNLGLLNMLPAFMSDCSNSLEMYFNCYPKTVSNSFRSVSSYFQTLSNCF